MQASLCLLDARQLQDARYSENENFRDQLAAADIIVANKQDTYSTDDIAALQRWQQAEASDRSIVSAAQGEIDVSLLDEPRRNTRDLPDGAHHHSHASERGLAALRLPGGEAWSRALNEGQGYFACGWIFSPETQFSTAALLDWVRSTPVDRIKGVMRIPEGTLIINWQGLDLHI